MTVWLPSEAAATDTLGTTLSGSPVMTAIPIDQNAYLWLVVAPGTISIDNTAYTTWNIPVDSQFRDKLTPHEAKHKTDLESGYHLTADFIPQIIGLAALDPYALQGMISLKHSQFFSSERARELVNRPQLEHVAYQLSDPLPPQYFYQSCGR